MVLHDRDPARPVSGDVDQVDVLLDLHAVRRPVVRRHGQPELHRYVGRFAARRPQVLDPGQGDPAGGRLLAGRGTPSGDDADEDQDDQDPAPGEEDGHVLDDHSHDEGGERPSGHRGDDRQAQGGKKHAHRRTPAHRRHVDLIDVLPGLPLPRCPHDRDCAGRRRIGAG
ncbi:hypothetical protein [Streptomyces microflavus]|uniref:hypothetical protein n=1 Tax=Streptomyces microflavus TaxID=1919 RepID=UPI0036B5F583